MEQASFLKRFAKKITIVQIKDEFTASHTMQQPIIHDPAIMIHHNSTIAEISGNEQHVTHATILNNKTHKEETIAVDGIFLAIGLKPNSDVFKEHVTRDARGYITIYEGTQTSVQGIFAAGDIHDHRYRQAITAAGSGCMAALDVDFYLKNLL
jgi:thioredoxin reductase (NADPH)